MESNLSLGVNQKSQTTFKDLLSYFTFRAINTLDQEKKPVDMTKTEAFNNRLCRLDKVPCQPVA